MNKELAILLQKKYPNDFTFVGYIVRNHVSDSDYRALICRPRATESSKILLKAANKFEHMVIV